MLRFLLTMLMLLPSALIAAQLLQPSSAGMASSAPPDEPPEPPAPLTETEQQAVVADAAMVAEAAITDAFIQSMDDIVYNAYLTGRVNEWTALENYYCGTGDNPLECLRVGQRRKVWTRARQSHIEHVQGTTTLARHDCVMTIAIDSAKADSGKEPYWYGAIADPYTSC